MIESEYFNLSQNSATIDITFCLRNSLNVNSTHIIPELLLNASRSERWTV